MRIDFKCDECLPESEKLFSALVNHFSELRKLTFALPFLPRFTCKIWEKDKVLKINVCYSFLCDQQKSKLWVTFHLPSIFYPLIFLSSSSSLSFSLLFLFILYSSTFLSLSLLVLQDQPSSTFFLSSNLILCKSIYKTCSDLLLLLSACVHSTYNPVELFTLCFLNEQIYKHTYTQPTATLVCSV